MMDGKYGKRKSYRIEQQSGDAEHVIMIRSAYHLTNDAAAFRQAMQDEILLLTAAKDPEKMTAMAAISRAKGGSVSALDRVLLSNNEGKFDELQAVSEKMIVCDDMLQALLTELHGMATNLNQIVHHLNRLGNDLNEDILVQALSLVEGIRDSFVASIISRVKHLEEVTQRGNPSIK
ncbi:plasmid mobilization relaxosome protein MobC [Lactiplantibacillus argentoratensis]|uniref:plasmid mobilization relaxosome protein MobC n=1 Tax=Lactiplantibacillus argentoratensis TaxID=271881 RepID=UPI0021AA7BE1|nr:plasmid mobilization relaxosome protein MobC [Lactiplantibacillus argentoratensis]MCT4444453.1 plasmid mobilization relaxosome protein MobC [Lactiplantibacillus argentoratensis]